MINLFGYALQFSFFTEDDKWFGIEVWDDITVYSFWIGSVVVEKQG
jgi:hypothetical protein